MKGNNLHLEYTHTHIHMNTNALYTNTQKKHISKTHFCPFHYLTFQQPVADSFGIQVQQQHVS